MRRIFVEHSDQRLNLSLSVQFETYSVYYCLIYAFIAANVVMKLFQFTDVIFYKYTNTYSAENSL